MERRKIKEIQLGSEEGEIFDLKCAQEEDIDNRKWFIVCDSYGVASVSSNPFPTQMKNNGLIMDELSVGMMSYGGNAVNVIPQLNNKIANMSQDSINSITDIICTLGLNDTWDNTNFSNIENAVKNFINTCKQKFPNLKMIHLAPCGNEMAIDETHETQATTMKTICHIIRQASHEYKDVIYVGNASIAMNIPIFFQADGTHPNEVGSNMLYDNFKSYMKTGQFPINCYSYIINEPSFGFKANIEYEGSNCHGNFEWVSTIAEFTVTGTNNFDLIFTGDVDLPIMRKIQLNPSIIAKQNSTGFVRGLLGLIGLTPKNSQGSTMILSGHGNTGGNNTEYYDNIRLYADINSTI